MEEEWKDVPGYDKYQISNLGNVKKKGYIKYDKRHKKDYIRYIREDRIIKPIKRAGYLYLSLSNNDGPRQFRIHRLVARVFLGLDIDDKQLFVCHKNDNTYDNRVDNLFIGTYEDNKLDMMEKKRHRYGEKHNNAIISEEFALQIIEMYNQGIKPKDIVRKTHLRRSIVLPICRGYTRKHLNNYRKK